MGGAAVSSAGAFSSGIELNAIQRSNRNAKRVANAIRGLVKAMKTYLSIHDHGLEDIDCLSEHGEYRWIN
jgi:phosphoribosylformylglycinamidine synthase